MGLERLLSASGVGRASFYRHFASKDDLVITMLRGHDRAYREWLETRVHDLGGDPLAVFDALAERSNWSDYRGCAFINAMAEMADPASPVFLIAKEHKRAVADFLKKRLAAAGYRDTEALALQLVLLIDGATVTALHERTNQPMRQAKAIAQGMLQRSNDVL
ncbi:transcriptional regulator, TetR family [Pelagibacterium halotolerans B2]|uniref:Transcriptional regulator, TetR family n=1 Tax=Pelagibacterium halotolerans (strain DSM 22347 / JCM 15775 / CGMCC 1.7692 / B2) TaxID=1082931 RepID=G4RA79_PELHB|nr:transcriptional regulator, TetR family [Pelagibacterium halotolerans B2]